MTTGDAVTWSINTVNTAYAGEHLEAIFFAESRGAGPFEAAKFGIYVTEQASSPEKQDLELAWTYYQKNVSS